MLRDELFNELYLKYAPKFEQHGLDFRKGFDGLFNTKFADGNNTMKQVLEKSLDAILQGYIDSKPKTKAGRWGRIGARIALIFEPLMKIFRK